MVEDRVLLVAMVGRHRLEQMGSSGERFYSLGEGAEGRVHTCREGVMRGGAEGGGIPIDGG